MIDSEKLKPPLFRLKNRSLSALVMMLWFEFKLA